MRTLLKDSDVNEDSIRAEGFSGFTFVTISLS